MNQQHILTRILEHKRTEVASRQDAVPLEQVIARAQAAPPVRNFAAALQKGTTTALIAEVKKASPSRGVLREDFDHIQLAQTYTAHGAAALSVLTDERFFQGSLDYLHQIRTMQAHATPPHMVPLLRKDFLLAPYQVYEARAYGADAVLLIVAALDDETLHALLALTHTLGMQALVEVHTEEEMERALHVGATIVGINNRDLQTFTTNLETTERLVTLVPAGAGRPVLVSESGIHTPADVVRLRMCGVDAILVGEALVVAPDTGARVQELVDA